MLQGHPVTLTFKVATKMLRETSEYGDHFCEIFVKSDFTKHCNGPDMILLQGHAVTLTFKVATKMLRVTHGLIWRSFL